MDYLPMPKIAIHEDTGTVYWIQGEEVYATPLNTDNTADLSQGVPVIAWENEEDEQSVRKILA